MARSYKSVDARTPEKSSKNVAIAPIVAENVVMVASPVADHCLQVGDIVSFRSNTRGTVLAINGDGVQVDFGLGSGWFNRDVLILVKVASKT